MLFGLVTTLFTLETEECKDVFKFKKAYKYNMIRA